MHSPGQGHSQGHRAQAGAHHGHPQPATSIDLGAGPSPQSSDALVAVGCPSPSPSHQGLPYPSQAAASALAQILMAQWGCRAPALIPSSLSSPQLLEQSFSNNQSTNISEHLAHASLWWAGPTSPSASLLTLRCGPACLRQQAGSSSLSAAALSQEDVPRFRAAPCSFPAPGVPCPQQGCLLLCPCLFLHGLFCAAPALQAPGTCLFCLP